jgi:two-component system, response regulator YesN
LFSVLIVDDEEDIREGLKTIIDWEKEGFKIAGLAENGVQALEFYKNNKPELIITDIKMPGMDGLEFVRQLRAFDSEVKILIISGYNDFSYAKKAMKYGVNSYLLKPVDIEELGRELGCIREEIYEKLFIERERIFNLQKLKNYFMTRMVRGELSEKNIENDAVQYNITTQGVNFCVLVMELGESKSSEHDAIENDIELKLFSIENIIQEIMYESTNGVIFNISETRLGILMTGSLE